MLWGGRWEGGSYLGTHVRIKDFKIKKKKENDSSDNVIIIFNRNSFHNIATGA